MIPVICIIILPLAKQPSRKKIWTGNFEIRKSCLSGHGKWRWSRQLFADQLETSTTHRVFDDHMCQGKGVLGFAVFRNFRVISMRFAVFACYFVWCLYLTMCSFAVFVTPFVPLFGEGDIWLLPRWSKVFELEMWVRWRSVKVKKKKKRLLEK